MTQIWLTGDRYNEVYLYDTATGDNQLFNLSQNVGPTAGNGGKVGGVFVATYVAADRPQIFIQVGRHRYPVDGTTHACARVTHGGMCTTVVIEGVDLPTQRLRLRTIRRWLSRRVDPTWDGLDEMAEDRAAGIASLVNVAEAQETFRRVKSPLAGPWHLLESPSS